MVINRILVNGKIVSYDGVGFDTACSVMRLMHLKASSVQFSYLGRTRSDYFIPLNNLPKF